MITLVCGKQKLKVSIKKAEAILHIQKEMKHGDWELSEDSSYEYINNALIKRANTGDCKEPTKKKSTPKSNEARAETEVSHGDNTPEA